MNPSLNRNAFFVKEHVGMFKAANNYDIATPENQEEVLIECREDLGFFTKLFRFTDYKRNTPFNIVMKTPSGEPVLRVSRGVTILTSKVDVWDENNQRVGGFKQKLFSFGAKFTVLDAQDQPVCMLKGNWRGWDFKFIRSQDEEVVAEVSKEWAGMAKELFTSADNYVLSINESVPEDAPIRLLIMAAVVCIDMVLKE